MPARHAAVLDKGTAAFICAALIHPQGDRWIELVSAERFRSLSVTVSSLCRKMGRKRDKVPATDPKSDCWRSLLRGRQQPSAHDNSSKRFFEIMRKECGSSLYSGGESSNTDPLL